MTVKKKVTRFRAYQLKTAGASYSYFDGSYFTLIEARFTDDNADSIGEEQINCGKERIDTLHITSWDQDHCVPAQLEQILRELSPKKIEFPGYDPHTDSGRESLKIITDFGKRPKNPGKIVKVSPDYIKGLDRATDYGYNHIFYHPKNIDEDSSNNNSTIKHFRTGSFNVLSLGDVESSLIAAGLKSYRTVTKETDILILAHHGANNGFTTSSFLKKVRPKLVIACADFDNQFEHPKQEIIDLLNRYSIPLYTTKTGDIIVRSTGSHVGKYQVTNLTAGSTKISSQKEFHSKKFDFLSANLDTIRSKITRKNRGPKK